jgi:transcriptional regulator with XRE-family HTH domain
MMVAVMTRAELKAWRKRLGLSQEKAAAALGVDRSTVAKWETGRAPISKVVALACRAVELNDLKHT